MKETKKEKRNFTFSIGFIEEFRQVCIPPGSNASVEMKRILRAEMKKIKQENEEKK